MAVTVPTVSAFTPVTTNPAAQATAAQIGTTAQATAAQIGTTAQVDPATVAQSALNTPTVSTTQDQLVGILNKGGPLMQQAATYGNQQAASRGLLNSSMGVQAAQAATLAQAVPIASADANATNQMNVQNANTLNQNLQTSANTKNTAAQWNAGATNQTNQTNVAATNQMAQSNAAAINQTNQTNAAATNQMAQSNVAAQNQFALTNNQNANAAAQWNAGQRNDAIKQTMDLNSREALANIEADYKQIMQVNSSAGTLYEQVLKNITDINNNPDISDKATAIQSQLSGLRSGLTMIQNLNGITGLVTF